MNRASLASGIACFVMGLMIHNFLPRTITNCQKYLDDPSKYFGQNIPWKCNIVQVMQLSSGILKVDATQLMLVGSLFLIVIGLALIAYGIVAKTQPKKNGIGVRKTNQDTIDILKTRLAKGEITKEEFDRLKGSLEEP